MPKRTVVTGALSLAATVATATIALVALTAGTGTGGTSASMAPPDTIPTTAPATPPTALDAEALARLAFVRAATATPDPTVDSGADTADHDVAASVAAFPSGSFAPAGDSDDDDSASAAPTSTTTAPAGFDCTGSDDGLSEAVKHAREEFCHREDDD